MFDKLRKALKSKKVKALEEERDSYLEVMTETVQDTNDLQREIDGLTENYRIQTWKWEQAERQLVQARAVINMKQRIIDDKRPMILKLEMAVLQSERDYRELLEEKTDDRKIFEAAYQEILNVLQNSADMTDLPVME